MPDEIPFALADRFQGVSPADVDEWPAQMVEDALERMAAESAWQAEQDADRRRHAAYQQSGGDSLADDFPEMG